MELAVQYRLSNILSLIFIKFKKKGKKERERLEISYARGSKGEGEKRREARSINQLPAVYLNSARFVKLCFVWHPS